jgi:transposase
MAINWFAACLQKQQVIDRLTEENQRLKQRLRYQERQATEGFFGSGTPSAKRPVEADTTLPQAPKRKGARPGYPGAGRRTFETREAERVVDGAAEVGDRCPACDAPLEEKGTDSRLVLDSHPVKAERVLYRLPKHYCPWCRRTFQPRVPVVPPKSLYG